MKFFAITDDVETYVGLRLAGIDGIVLEDRATFSDKLREFYAEKSIGILLVTEGLVAQDRELFLQLKMKKGQPLVIEIPSVKGTYNIGKTIEGYVQEAVGLRF